MLRSFPVGSIVDRRRRDSRDVGKKKINREEKGGQFSFIYRNEVKNLMDSRSRFYCRGLEGN